MKVFWSWQSDTDGEIGRHFVRDALDLAISELRSAGEVEDAQRPDTSELHLDHDRKGVPGSPDLVALILNKIKQSSMFVADITPVATTSKGKRVMNPNVAIELGYALEAVGDKGILLVLNTAYGGRSDLPFDLQHKAGPIMYRLTADASKADVKAEKPKLVAALKEAISLYIATHRARPMIAAPPFPEMQAKRRVSSFLNEGDRLCRLLDRWEKQASDIIWHDGPQMFLRLIPTKVLRTWNAAELVDLVDDQQFGLRPFGRVSGTWSQGNEFGAVVFEARGGDKLQDTANRISQVSEHGEIWGIDGSSLQGEKIIPWFEDAFIDRLDNYRRFAMRSLGLEQPFKVIAGMAGVADYQYEFPRPRPGHTWPNGALGGSCTKNEVVVELRALPDQPARSTLAPFFKAMWGAGSINRSATFHWIPLD